MKNMLVLIAGIIATMMAFVGCANPIPKAEEDFPVKVEVEVEKEPEDDWGSDWVRYTYVGKDARRVAEAGQDWHLDNGETVTELYESSAPNGDRIYFYKVKVAG